MIVCIGRQAVVQQCIGSLVGSASSAMQLAHIPELARVADSVGNQKICGLCIKSHECRPWCLSGYDPGPACSPMPYLHPCQSSTQRQKHKNQSCNLKDQAIGEADVDA